MMVGGGLVLRQWTPAHQIHLVLKHVPELRELVETAAAQLSPVRRHTWVVIELEVCPFIPFMRAQLGLKLFSSGARCTELAELKAPPVLPDALLVEQHRVAPSCQSRPGAASRTRRKLHRKV